MSFLGVCAAALFVIPGFCSLAIDPFTKRIFKIGKSEQQQKQVQKTQIDSKNKLSPYGSQFSNYRNKSVMRVC